MSNAVKWEKFLPFHNFKNNFSDPSVGAKNDADNSAGAFIGEELTAPMNEAKEPAHSSA